MIDVFNKDYSETQKLATRMNLTDYSGIIHQAILDGRVKVYVYRLNYYTVIEKVDGLYVKRFFVYRKPTKKIEGFVKEVARMIEGRYHPVVDANHLRYNGCGSYSVFGNKLKPYWEAVMSFQPWEHLLTDLHEVINNDPDLKYCKFFNQQEMDFIHYVTYFKTFPAATECLTKQGLVQLLPYYRMFNKHGHSYTEILKLNQEWINALKNKDYGYLKAREYYKQGLHPYSDEVDIIEKAKQMLRGESKVFKPLTWRKYIKIYNYITSNNLVLREYLDYIHLANRNGKDITDSYWLYPKNLSEAHEDMIQEDLERTRIAKEEERKKIIAENKEFDVNIKKVAKKMAIDYQEEDLEIKIAKDLNEILKTGSELSICVGSLNMPYIENMSKKKNVILIAYYKDRITECIEYDWRKNNFLQVRGRNNQDSSQHSRILEMLDKFKQNRKAYGYA